VRAMTFLRYPAYKDSGVAWLDDVPAHWEVRQLGRIGSFSKGGGGTKEDEVEDGVPCVRYGNLYTQYRFFIERTKACVSPEKALAYTPIHYGDVLFAGSGETIEEIGKSAVNLLTEPACCGGDIILFRPSISVDAKFFGYATDCPQATFQKACMGRGFTVMHIYASELKYLRVALPPLPEQHAIAAFLDTETARIDTLVAKQVSLIATLQEKRRALISHVVTKGLDPAAPMKDSGVLWLGEVPKHWEVKAIKWLSPVQRGASPRPIDDPKYFDDEGEYAWVRIADVTAAEDGYLRITTQRLSPLGSSLSVKLDPGALFLSIAGSVGKPCISCIKACIHDGFVYFPHLRENNKFLFYIFEAGTAFQGLGKLGTQLNLNTDTVGSIRIGVPPKVEQDAIVAFIERESDRVDTLITKSQEMIAVLREHRTALVAAAVTGQIDVREPSRESGRIK